MHALAGSPAHASGVSHMQSRWGMLMSARQHQAARSQLPAVLAPGLCDRLGERCAPESWPRKELVAPVHKDIGAKASTSDLLLCKRCISLGLFNLSTTPVARSDGSEARQSVWLEWV
jgi:hypothetical protein